MKITKLTLTAFRSFLGTEINTDAPRVLVAGLNGTGKTSIRETIRWTLLGRAQGLDGKGSGVECLVPNGSPAQTVETAIAIDGIGTVSRRWTPSGAAAFVVTGFTGTAQAQQTGLLSILKTSPAFLQAVIDSSVFLSLDHPEAKALVLSLLDVVVTVKAKTYLLEDLDVAYKHAYEERRAAKAQQKNLAIVPKPTDEGIPRVEAVEARLAQVRLELEDLTRQIGETLGQRKTLHARLAVLERRPASIIPPEDQIPGQIEELEERLALMEDTTRAVAVADHPESLQILKSREAALAAHDPKHGCVLDPAVPCDTVKAKFGKQAMVLRKEIERMPTPTLPVADPKADVLARLEALHRLQARHQQQRDAEMTRRQEYDDVTQQIAELPDVSAQEAAIADRKDRIHKGEGILQKARSYQAALQAHQTNVEARKALDAKVDELEAACEALGPSGARVQALAEKMGQFEAQINPALQPFGWLIHISVEPWGVIVNDRPVQTYSRSEQYRIGVAVQLAIAQISGLRFAIVDELDMLDAANRELLGRILYQSDLEQVIILSTREPSVPFNHIPNLVAVRLGKQGERSVVLETTAVPQEIPV